MRKTALLAPLALPLGMPASAAVLPSFGHKALRAEGLADFGVGLFDLEQTSQIFVVFYGAVEVLVASARGSSSTT